MIGLLAVILLAVNGKEDGYMCDSIYAEYDSCENQNSIVMKKWVKYVCSLSNLIDKFFYLIQISNFKLLQKLSQPISVGL